MLETVWLVALEDPDGVIEILTAYSHKRRAQQAIHEIDRLGRLDDTDKAVTLLGIGLDHADPAPWFRETVEEDTDA